MEVAVKKFEVYTVLSEFLIRFVLSATMLSVAFAVWTCVETESVTCKSPNSPIMDEDKTQK